MPSNSKQSHATQLEQLATHYEATAQLIRSGNAEEYDEKAKAIRLTLQLMHEHMTGQAAATLPDKLRGAVEHRKNGGSPGPGRPRKIALSMASVAEILQQAEGPMAFDEVRDALQLPNGRRLNPYLNRLRRDGYVKKVAGGFVSKRPYMTNVTA